MTIKFSINDIPFSLNTIGKHNMENALASVAVAVQLGISLETCSNGIAQYEGIHRRHQLLGKKNGVYVIDDYGHNPVKCAASIDACQEIAPKVIAWFQPHGYGPTRFLKNDFIHEFVNVLRPEDEIWMSEIFYAGGSAVKDISANDLIVEIKNAGKQAFFAENRNEFLEKVRPHLTNDCVLLLMGARDPSLETFSKSIWENL
jgi:UDP-N-acetylmuramate--alanine ligase